MVQQWTQGLIYLPSDCFLRIRTYITTQAMSAPWVPFSKMPQRQAGCQGDLANACPDSLGSSISQRAHPTSNPGQEFSLLAPQGLGSNSALPPGGQAVLQNPPDWGHLHLGPADKNPEIVTRVCPAPNPGAHRRLSSPGPLLQMKRSHSRGWAPQPAHPALKNCHMGRRSELGPRTEANRPPKAGASGSHTGPGLIS